MMAGVPIAPRLPTRFQYSGDGRTKSRTQRQAGSVSNQQNDGGGRGRRGIVLHPSTTSVSPSSTRSPVQSQRTRCSGHRSSRAEHCLARGSRHATRPRHRDRQRPGVGRRPRNVRHCPGRCERGQRSEPARRREIADQLTEKEIKVVLIHSIRTRNGQPVCAPRETWTTKSKRMPG